MGPFVGVLCSCLSVALRPNPSTDALVCTVEGGSLTGHRHTPLAGVRRAGIERIDPVAYEPAQTSQVRRNFAIYTDIEISFENPL